MASSRRRVGSVTLLVLAAVGVVRSQDRFEAILWRHEGPTPSAAWAAALKRAGITAVSVDQAEHPKKIADLGLRFYLDHAAGKGILHLRDKQFRPALAEYERTRSTKALERPWPLLSGRTRAQLLELVRERVARAVPHKPLLVSLDDEISATRLANPLDFCFAESSLTGFRAWLRARYGTIDALNRTWGATYERFDDVFPRTTDEVRKRELGFGLPQNLADWNDHRAFMDSVLQQTIALVADAARKLAPGVPVGFEGGQAPAAFGGWDWAQLLEAVDYVEPYDIGGTRELVRSLKRPGTRHFETLFPGDGDASFVVAQLYDKAAHGLAGTIVWSNGRFFADDPLARGPKLSSFGRALAAELPRLTSPRANVLAGAECFAGEIAILESQASVRLHWMLDSARDGRTWTRRFGSYERTHSTSIATRLSWVRLLQDLGYAFRFVTPRQVQIARWSGRPPRVLILAGALAMSRRTARAVAAFAAAGGLVVADEAPARYDDRLMRLSQPPLDELFGCHRDGGKRWLREGKLVRGAARLGSGLGVVATSLRPEGITVASELPGALSEVDRLGHAENLGKHGWCQFERSVGQGRAVLLNLAVCEYSQQRLDQSKIAACRDLRARLRRLFDRNRTREIAIVRVRGYPTLVERVLLTKGRRKVLVVRANCLEGRAVFDKLVARGEVPMTIVLPLAAKITDLWTGVLIGRGRRIEARLDPVRGSFFVVEPF